MRDNNISNLPHSVHYIGLQYLECFRRSSELANWRTSSELSRGDIVTQKKLCCTQNWGCLALTDRYFPDNFTHFHNVTTTPWEALYKVFVTTVNMHIHHLYSCNVINREEPHLQHQQRVRHYL